MEWTAIFTIVLGSSFLGAILTNAVGWLRKHVESSNHARYLALHLAHIFEKYSYMCLSVVEDHDAAESSYGNVGKFLDRIPTFSDLPDFDYRVLDLELLDRILEFPQQVIFAGEDFSFSWVVMDRDDAIYIGYKSCVQLAQQSLQISDMVRKKYKLATRALKYGEYSVRERLNEKSSIIQKSR